LPHLGSFARYGSVVMSNHTVCVERINPFVCCTSQPHVHAHIRAHDAAALLRFTAAFLCCPQIFLTARHARCPSTSHRFPLRIHACTRLVFLCRTEIRPPAGARVSAPRHCLMSSFNNGDSRKGKLRRKNKSAGRKPALSSCFTLGSSLLFSLLLSPPAKFWLPAWPKAHCRYGLAFGTAAGAASGCDAGAWRSAVCFARSFSRRSRSFSACASVTYCICCKRPG